MQSPPFILICTDKFRGSLEAQAVAEALKRGFMSQMPDAVVVIRSLADGGEGTFEVLTEAAGGDIQTLTVANALGEAVAARYGYAGDTRTAFIGMSQASGLAMLPPEARNPLLTHTYGTGEMILDAIRRGARRVVMGIGGSATNDAGMGMACALGYRFLDQQHRVLPPCGGSLIHIAHIDRSQAVDLKGITFQVACDVDNPLFGLTGAAHVYGPQKGATPAMVEQLDAGVRHFAGVVRQQLGLDAAHIPGAGAAGGLGFGAMVFLQAELRSGIDLVIEHTALEHWVQQADLIVTGEGKLDEQTLQGKVVAGVARLAQKHQKPVVAVCGTLSLHPQQIRALGLCYAESILTRPMSLEAAQAEAADLLADWAARFCGVLGKV